MARKFYCSICGVELVHSRKAIPGKGTILDLISPHECEGYSIKSNEFDSPTVQDILDNLKPIGGTIKASDGESKGSAASYSDRREEIRSTAPQSLLDRLKMEKGLKEDE